MRSIEFEPEMIAVRERQREADSAWLDFVVATNLALMHARRRARAVTLPDNNTGKLYREFVKEQVLKEYEPKIERLWKRVQDAGLAYQKRG
jgi:hypothetical protein